MDLATSYLGFHLPHPFIVGASPLADDLDTVRRLEDAGAAAIVMRSLFEEQLAREQLSFVTTIESYEGAFAEASSFWSPPRGFTLGPQEYVEQLRRVKAAVGVPVVASLNGAAARGSEASGWLETARLLEEAGADALELNVYYLATDPDDSAEMIERRTLATVAAVRQAVSIPLAVKLSPYYTALANFARRLAAAGADGLVLFNRFYQPDLDVEALRVDRSLRLSSPAELPLRLRWLAVLAGAETLSAGAAVAPAVAGGDGGAARAARSVRAEDTARAGGGERPPTAAGERVGPRPLSLAASGGVHRATDAVKAVMAGAHAVQVVSALLRHGPDYLRLLRDGLAGWMRDHAYGSLREMRGCLSLRHCPDPAAYERANYLEVLQGWSGPL